MVPTIPFPVLLISNDGGMNTGSFIIVTSEGFPPEVGEEFFFSLKMGITNLKS
jgi:hypothetical protein